MYVLYVGRDNQTQQCDPPPPHQYSRYTVTLTVLYNVKRHISSALNFGQLTSNWRFEEKGRQYLIYVSKGRLINRHSGLLVFYWLTDFSLRFFIFKVVSPPKTKGRRKQGQLLGIGLGPWRQTLFFYYYSKTSTCLTMFPFLVRTVQLIGRFCENKGRARSYSQILLRHLCLWDMLLWDMLLWDILVVLRDLHLCDILLYSS